MMHLLNGKDATGPRHNPSPQQCGNTARGDFIIVLTVKVSYDRKECCRFVSFLSWPIICLISVTSAFLRSMHFAAAWQH